MSILVYTSLLFKSLMSLRLFLISKGAFKQIKSDSKDIYIFFLKISISNKGCSIPKILKMLSVSPFFKIDNNQKCFLSTILAY